MEIFTISIIIVNMKNKSLSEIIFGIIVLALGAGFLLEALNVFDFGSVIGTYWPSIFIIIGATSLIMNSKNFVWPVIIIVAGVLLQLRELQVIQFDVWGIIWPIVLILAGVALLFGSSQSGKKRK